MELREVIGRRRSIRFLRPYRPVEPEKIQRMLEAARLASHWGNVQSLRAVVVFRDSAPRRAGGASRPRSPVSRSVSRRSSSSGTSTPRPSTCRATGSGNCLMSARSASARARRTPSNASSSHSSRPSVRTSRRPASARSTAARASRRRRSWPSNRASALAVSARRRRQGPQEPRTARTLPGSSLLQTVGYPPRARRPVGSAPAQPFDELFFMNTYGNPFPRSGDVVEELHNDGMFTARALPHGEGGAGVPEESRWGSRATASSGKNGGLHEAECGRSPGSA